MEQVRNIRLDHLAEAFSERRELMNALITDDTADKRVALEEMHRAEITSYRHAGTEFARVSGEEKIRVRTSKEKATTAAEPTEEEVVDGTDGVGGIEA